MDYKYTGYKYTKANNRIYLIKLKCANEFIRPMSELLPIDYFTTNCVIEKIVDINTGVEIDSVSGEAMHKYTFEKGSTIKGTGIYYCKLRTALYVAYLYMHPITGLICDVHTQHVRLQRTEFYQEEIIPGLADELINAIRTTDSKTKAIYKVNDILLKKEKELFDDEERTIDEILHVDKMRFEDIPPEIKGDMESLEEVETYYRIKEKLLYRQFWGKDFTE